MSCSLPLIHLSFALSNSTKIVFLYTSNFCKKLTNIAEQSRDFSFCKNIFLRSSVIFLFSLGHLNSQNGCSAIFYSHQITKNYLFLFFKKKKKKNKFQLLTKLTFHTLTARQGRQKLSTKTKLLKTLLRKHSKFLHFDKNRV